MITVARFSKAEEANLLRMQLEAGGVPAYVLDENTIQAYWFYSDAVGGVRVQIRDEDWEQAQVIMQAPPVPDSELAQDADAPLEDP